MVPRHHGVPQVNLVSVRLLLFVGIFENAGVLGNVGMQEAYDLFFETLRLEVNLVGWQLHQSCADLASLLPEPSRKAENAFLTIQRWVSAQLLVPVFQSCLWETPVGELPHRVQMVVPK